MSTDSDESHPGSTADSVHDGASSQSDSDSESQTTISARSTQSKEPARKLSTLLADDPFVTGESKLLFEAIDELRRCGAGQDLHLPQLVIVGKQSVGKSSLLQSLTDIPFPVSEELCTRFATRIISRRTVPGTPDQIKVFIEKGEVDPFGDSKDDDQTSQLDFPEDQKSMSAQYFRDLVDKASAAMGISDGKGGGRNFSSKVLKIELSGPGRSHFGILDLPGIFGAATGPITNRDREGVDKVVTAYMRQPENIIVCVADAVDNLANQRILSLAADHADMERIVGVFTKCDMTDNPERIVSIVENSEATTGQPLRHGWFVVQNRGLRDDPSLFDREKAERLTFGKEPWLKIEEKRRGTTNLKTFLSNLLCQRIRECFPKMLENMERLLDDEVAHLNAMGRPRQTPGVQRAYLVEIAQRFQTLATQALKSPENLPSEEMKLRGKVERAKDEFAEDLRLRGHLYEFFSGSELEATTGVNNNHAKGIIGNAVGRSGQNPRKDRTLYDEIKSQIHENQGTELHGMINPAVLKPLLQKQASKWPELAKQHLEHLARLTNNAVHIILKQACKDVGAADYTWEELDQIVTSFATAARSCAIEKLNTRWREEVTLHLQTSNPAFIINVKLAQRMRFMIALDRYAKRHPPHTFITTLVSKPEEIGSLSGSWESWAIIDNNTSNALLEEMHSHTEKNTQDEIHDLLKAYYEVALEDFISYVNRHIVEPFLHDNAGPVLGLSTEYIMDLKDEEVEELGGEHEKTIQKRQKAEATIKRLRAAQDIAKQTLRKTKALAELKL